MRIVARIASPYVMAGGGFRVEGIRRELRRLLPEFHGAA